MTTLVKMGKKRKLKNALENYGSFLRRSCNKEDLIELILEDVELFHSVTLIAVYYKEKKACSDLEGEKRDGKREDYLRGKRKWGGVR